MIEKCVGKTKPRSIIIEKPVIFFTDEELMRLYHYEVPPTGTQVELTDKNGHKYTKKVSDKSTLEHTRDCFCFCAFTSLRYSDRENLRRTDIRGGEIFITTQKTNDRIPIVLHEKAQAILDKYKDEDIRNGKALPYMTNQQMNRCLKDLGEICGFNTSVHITLYRNGVRHDEVYPKWSQIGTHTGRKTFICFALSNGVPPDVVMKFTGHCDYKSMKPYIDITDSAKRDAIKKMEEAFRK